MKHEKSVRDVLFYEETSRRLSGPLPPPWYSFEQARRRVAKNIGDTAAVHKSRIMRAISAWSLKHAQAEEGDEGGPVVSKSKRFGGGFPSSSARLHGTVPDLDEDYRSLTPTHFLGAS